MEISSFIADFENLPKSVQQQVIDYISFLKNKYKNKDSDSNKDKKQKEFSFNWKGGLSEFKDDFTSVELQHRINKLR